MYFYCNGWTVYDDINKLRKVGIGLMMTAGVWQAWLIPLAIVFAYVFYRRYLKDENVPQNINNGWYIVSFVMMWYFLQCVVIVAVDGFVLIRFLITGR